MFEDEILLIIGNGFDIDLGLKTSYSDFVESPVFKKNVYNNSLLQYLSDDYQKKKWIDIEKSLLNYINEDYLELDESLNIENIESFQENFQCLRKSLINYLEEIDFSRIKDYSFSARLLRTLIKKHAFILSFNYTDLERIMYQINALAWDYSFSNVHGKLKNESIIIGVQDDVEIPENANFIIKSHSEYYRSCAVRDKLEEADHIIFFGHSLGETDYHYFRDFFQKQSGLLREKPKRKKITIFTYDEKSRQDILSQLRRMNEKRVNYLFDLNDVEFFRTGCSEDLKNIDKFLKKMGDDFKAIEIKY